MNQQQKSTSGKRPGTPKKAATAGGKATTSPLPPTVRKALSKVEHCRAELAAVYREARAGRLNIADASRLGNILSLLARMIEGSDLEKRIEALESLQQEEKRT